VLYRALAHHFERFLQLYEERFERTHGYLRRCVRTAVYRYLDCGIFAHGVARAHCEACGHDFLIAFSCKLRCLCPSCHQKRELQWAQWAAEELLEEVPHRQVVLTLPKRLRIFFRFDRRLLGELPGCAWRALRLYLAAAFDRADIVPGAIGFVQTAGELLGWHPHLHVLLADGGWLPDGTFRHLLDLDSSQVEKLFRAEVLKLLVERRKIGDEVVESLLSWRHSGFSVPAGVRVEERSEAVRLGRYGIRCPLVLDRLARVLDHLPEPSQQLVRYWGWYSNASRGRRRRRQGETGITPTECAEPGDEGTSRRLSWSQLIRKVYEIDPLLCTFCGATMRIVAFLVERSSLRRILQHLDGDGQQPEPLAHSPPAEAELVFVPA
jgi:hypothetical protein